MKEFRIPYDIFREKLNKRENIFENSFEIVGNYKFDDCWIGYIEEFNEYWFGLTPDGNNTYEYKTADEILNAPVFDGKSMHELWDKVNFYSINGLGAEEWFLYNCVKFYRCRKQDAYNVAKLACKLWEDSDYDELKSEFEAISNCNNEIVFTAYVDEKMIAFSHCSIRKEYVEGTKASPVAYLEAIYVEKEYRKAGIATNLISFCENWAKDKGLTEFASDCDINNAGSRSLHKHNGFNEASTLVHYVKGI
ncbi:MAG: aminoglycoside 6'-N-acetyltransferase [Eubacterium sp.]